MNIVEQVARLIDPNAFEALWIPNTELEKTRQKYLQTKARLTAVEILKLANSRQNLKEELIEYEMQGWRELGVPVDDPILANAVSIKYSN